MTFTTDILKISNERRTLIKLNSARHVSSDLSLVSGLYEMSVSNLNIESVERNGTELTEVFVTPTSNDTYQITNDIIKIKLASAPSTTTNVIILTHNLFYTTDKTLFEYENPVAGSGDVVKWKPRVLDSPAFNQTIRNVTKGLITLSSTSIKLANDDYHFNQYLGIEDSFYNRPVSIWLKVKTNLNTTYKLVFEGVVSNLSVSERVIIQLKDKLQGLNASAYMGATADSAYFIKTGTYSDIRDTDDGKPIPYIFTRSPHGFFNNKTITATAAGISGLMNCYTLDQSKCFTATCTSFSPYKTTSNNRVWTTARSEAFKTLNFGTISAAVSTNDHIDYPFAEASYTTGRTISITTTSNHNIEVGDTWKIYDGTSQYYYLLAVRVSSTSIIAIMANNTGTGRITPTTSGVDVLTGYTWFTNNAPAIMITNGTDRFFPLYGRDFTSIVSLGVNTILFTSNFEQYHSGLDVLDPESYEIHYRISTSSEISHANAVKDILEAADLIVDSSSITQADSDLTANVIMSIPDLGENEYSPYSDYLSKILKSTLGYVKLKSGSTSFEYNLYSTPSSTDERTKNNCNFINISIEYRDINTEVIFSNPRSSFRYGTVNSVDTSDDSEIKTSNKSKFLHKINKSIKYEHVLDDITGRSQAIIDVISNRTARYMYTSGSIDLDKTVGDDVKLVDTLLGSDTSKQLSIVTLNVSEDSVTIEADDLGEL